MMARPAAQQKLVVSILDRLIDQEPAGISPPQGDPSRDLAQIKASVKRDLEWLLNSRQPLLDTPGDLRHIRRSLLTFGLPDFTVASLDSTRDQDLLRRAIEETVRRFEPRLADVTVRIEAGREFDRSLRFRIDGMLQVDPEPEPVTFDSVLQLNTRDFVVQGE
jgi:type VI secretion system protein ImpF